MKKTNIEIPFPENRGFRYRCFEILPGALSWTILALPFILSLINPFITVFFILGYLLLWFAKSIGLDVRAVQGYKTIKEHEKLPWLDMVEELKTGVALDGRPAWHYRNIERITETPVPIKPDDIVHTFIIATYNESRAVLEPTIKSILNSEFDMKRVIVMIAYEERGGEQIENSS